MNNMVNMKRRDKDITKLLMSNYDVIIVNEAKMNELYVILKGPQDSPYEEGYWKVLVSLQDDYPYKSPSIGFINKIYHPNIDESSGSVCLDVINQTWSPMYDLVNIFDTFLPQLLLYPNPSDPLNPNAAKLLKEAPDSYFTYVKDHVKKNACTHLILDTNKFSNNKSIKETTSVPKKVTGIIVNNINDIKSSNFDLKDNSNIKNEDKNENGSVISEASVGDLNEEEW